MPALPISEKGPVLVILLEGLGDSLAFSPALRALRKSRPDVEIDLLVSETASQVFESRFDRTRLLHWSGSLRPGKGFLAMIRMLRRRQYELAIVPGLLFRHRFLARLSGSATRAGFEPDRRDSLLNRGHPLDRSQHRIHCYRDLMGSIGVAWDGDSMEVPVGARRHAPVPEFVPSPPPGQSPPLVLIHPGAAQQVNRWPENRYARLADRLAELSGATILFSGSRADVSTVNRIRRAMKIESSSAAGRTSINRLAALIGRADLLVCPDTGVMHLGAAVGTSTVAIVGGRNRETEWIPLSDVMKAIRSPVSCSPCYRSECPRNDNFCMKNIGVKEVLDCALSLLEGSRTKETHVPMRSTA